MERHVIQQSLISSTVSTFKQLKKSKLMHFNQMNNEIVSVNHLFSQKDFSSWKSRCTIIKCTFFLQRFFFYADKTHINISIYILLTKYRYTKTKHRSTPINSYLIFKIIILTSYKCELDWYSAVFTDDAVKVCRGLIKPPLVPGLLVSRPLLLRLVLKHNCN